MRPPQDGEVDPPELERPKLRTYILKTLSGQIGVTTLDDGKTQSGAPWPKSGPEDADRPLRIGYLGGELIGGPSFYFLSPLLGNHDSSQFQTFRNTSRFSVGSGRSQRKEHLRTESCIIL